MKHETAQLVEAIKKAVAAGMELKDTDDGGTCNLDSAFIRVPGMRVKQVKEIAALAGAHIFLGSHFGTRVLFIGETLGQGNRRSAMMTAQRRSLEADGIDCGGYYQMD